ncbi:MAG TPA: bifunctional transaldolase/phosoglucose isomerase [Pyrinomonadaceae bacterium]|jgi:glucose-6-phosphate isomerase|nr:bifunctional transaldolase/phosoglucose isomerase [Pyrinomonadaceae bacterium]
MSSRARQRESLGHTSESLFEAALERMERERVMSRIWERDATLWKADERERKVISNALGWLDVVQMMSERAVGLIDSFAREVREAGFKHLMLLGMGGSSLCPEVLRRTFGRREGFPELVVLDTTDPDTIASFERRVDLAHTLFIVSSKSGTTIEPLSFYKYFFNRVGESKPERAGENFVAVTDPGTLMERQATEARFRHVFLNPPDIGGRYSALSYFGMVPAALMGLDVGELLRRASDAVEACAARVPARENEAARLGCMMGALALAGRDKLTLVMDESLASLGLWIEQLVAESTGKEGRGIVPIAGETLGAPEVYGSDRVFVAIGTGAPAAEASDGRLRALEDAGHPVVYRTLADLYDLGAEFFIWELATAVAGQLMSINPFDQPNVQESKDNTNRLLESFKRTGALPEQQAALASEGELKVYTAARAVESSSTESTATASSSPDAESTPAGSGATPPTETLSSVVDEFIGRAGEGDYVALLAYIEETDRHDRLLEAVRTSLRDALRLATTTGYGPRFLHSTGQLHKGGPASGVFIQLTDDDETDLPIPGEPYSFSVLKQAQALGDFSALADHHRRALRLHLGRDAEAGLRRLLDIVRARVSAPHLLNRARAET